MEKNRGISLIEVLVVVIILAVFVGGIALTYSVVHSADTNGCTQSLDTYLEKAKNECMSKEEPVYMVVYKSSDSGYPGYYIGTVKKADLTTYSTNPKDDRKIAGNQINISVESSTGSSIDIDNSGVYFSFDRGTGAFLPVLKGIPAVATSLTPASIIVSSGENETTITCVEATGKHFIE